MAHVGEQAGSVARGARAAGRASRRSRSARNPASSASTSSADSTSFAPDLMSAWQPLDERRMDRARNGEHFASLLGGGARRDERAGGERGFDHQAAAREAADQPVAARKIVRRRRRAQRKLATTAGRARRSRRQARRCAADRRCRCRCRARRWSSRRPQARRDAPRHRCPGRGPETMVSPASLSALAKRLGVALRPARGVAAADDGERRALTAAPRGRAHRAAAADRGFRAAGADRSSSARVMTAWPGCAAHASAARRPARPRRNRAQREPPAGRSARELGALAGEDRLRQAELPQHALRKVAAPRPGVSASCSQLASPGSWIHFLVLLTASAPHRAG